MDACWSDPGYVLAVVERVLSGPSQQRVERFAAELAPLVPHHLAAMLAGFCLRSPLKVAGDPAVARAVTSAEMRRLAERGEPGRPMLVRGVLGGRERELVVFTTAPVIGQGAVLAVARRDAEAPPEDALAVAAQLWNIFGADAAQRAAEPAPGPLAGSLAAAAARSQAISDLSQTHATTLSALLAVLRSNRLADAVARRTATDLATDALLDLNRAAGHDEDLIAQPARAAFAMLRQDLIDLARHADADVELVDPDGNTMLPQDLAHTARALTRGLILAALARPGTTRLRASWSLDGPTMRITVRDDGDVADPAPAPGLTELLTALGGRWEIDAVPHWGTTIGALIPLSPAETPELGPLQRLNAREIEVLAGISQGLRNRQIAEQLQLSEHTIKFHVRNLLGKLQATSRGQAAALVRDLHGPGPRDRDLSRPR
ncbi:LuxR C-terminal-related transcriptional regulator [Dactylosporangium sp. CA-233914]|uniref:response regulator transcription factor n=1 Tax=Dactylosporangium sp. CA-233914 TaxID=3239934 RepID=UPI003D937C5B